jgi:hypothetical protein
MSEAMIRGHILAHTVRFARAHLDWSGSERLASQLSVELSSVLEGVTGAGWYPRKYQVELLHAFASARGRSEVAYGDLILCGSAMAAVDNHFMSLLMKVMTPELFVRKLPMFWKRDHQGSGAIEVAAFADGSTEASLKLTGVSGYDFAAVLWLGWIKHVLDGLCSGRADVSQTGWSWPNPGPAEVVFDVRWS